MGYRHFSPATLHRTWAALNASQRRRFAAEQDKQQRRKEGVPGRTPALPGIKVETNPAPPAGA